MAVTAASAIMPNTAPVGRVASGNRQGAIANAQPAHPLDIGTMARREQAPSRLLSTNGPPKKLHHF
jgi:hypothetical protein